MPDVTAKIKAKGLTNTGVTEDLARKLYDQLGTHHLAVVELRVEAHVEDQDGQRTVSLVLSQVEPSTSTDMDDHLRDLQRALHYERKLLDSDGQLTIDTREHLEPKVSDVIAEGAKRRPHEFQHAPDNKTTCDVCGRPEDTSLHAAAALGDTGDQDDAA